MARWFQLTRIYYYIESIEIVYKIFLRVAKLLNRFMSRTRRPWYAVETSPWISQNEYNFCVCVRVFSDVHRPRVNMDIEKHDEFSMKPYCACQSRMALSHAWGWRMRVPRLPHRVLWWNAFWHRLWGNWCKPNLRSQLASDLRSKIFPLGRKEEMNLHEVASFLCSTQTSRKEEMNRYVVHLLSFKKTQKSP